MWGNKKKQAQVSEFLKGANIFGTLLNSAFGKIKQTFSEIFTPKEFEQYKLPKIIVIGNESTGKSSLLENITKCQLFPRDSKLCTKCPIHVKLTNGESKYNVSYVDRVSRKLITIELEQKNEIYQVINDYMNKMPQDYITDKEITISITDNDIPTFEFYDLPGIRTYPPNTAEITTSICKKYLRDKNAIVLCVVPATTPRLTSCQSIALISEMKMEHNCILALTMSDRLQPEHIEELLVKRILQTSDELNELDFAGYVAVINRVHSDSYNLEEHDKNEISWFYDNLLEQMPDEYIKHEQEIRNNITINNLILKMDDLYNKFIHDDWKPRILEMISHKLDYLKNEYIDLGDDTISCNELNHVIRNYINFLYQTAQSQSQHYYKITDLKNLFVEDLNDVDEYDDENDYIDSKYDNDQEAYHGCIELIDAEIEKYTNFDSTFITCCIDDYFGSDTKYKLKRYVNIQNNLKNTLQKDFELLAQENVKKIGNIIKDYALRYYVEGNRTLYATINEKIFEMYKLFVLYPLLILNLNICYNDSDYVESNEYKQKREDLLKQINQVQKHFDSITNM